MSLPLLNYHRGMLADSVRMHRWRQTIERLVRPGHVVVDLGAGTGILSFLACAAGASRVYAIEEAPIVEVARDIARITPFADRITFLAESSWDVRLPERADVLIGDVFGAFGLNGNVLRSMIDARTRFLKPGGLLLPQRTDLFCMPVELPGYYRDVISCWSADLCGFDHRPGRRRVVNHMHLCAVPPEASLAEPACVGSAEFLGASSPAWKGSAGFLVSRAGILHGLAGWCTAWWTPEISASNSPLAAERLAWSQAFFPIEEPVPVEPGDRVSATVDLAAHGSRMIWRWEVTVDREGSKKSRFRHSTFQAELISLEDILRQRPDSRPRVSPRGEIVRAVLELCDGSRSVRDIQVEILRRFPVYFQEPSQAARLVGGVVRALCR